MQMKFRVKQSGTNDIARFQKNLQSGSCQCEVGRTHLKWLQIKYIFGTNEKSIEIIRYKRVTKDIATFRQNLQSGLCQHEVGTTHLNGSKLNSFFLIQTKIRVEQFCTDDIARFQQNLQSVSCQREIDMTHLK